MFTSNFLTEHTMIQEIGKEFQFSSVAQSLQLHESQHTRPPCPSPEFTQTHVHRVGDAIQPSHPSSVVPFSSCPQSLPASLSFPMSQLFAWSDQAVNKIWNY